MIAFWYTCCGHICRFSTVYFFLGAAFFATFFGVAGLAAFLATSFLVCVLAGDLAAVFGITFFEVDFFGFSAFLGAGFFFATLVGLGDFVSFFIDFFLLFWFL